LEAGIHKKNVASASTSPSTAFQWVTEVKLEGMDFNRLRFSAPFHTLDVKLSLAFSRILSACPDLHREINLEENRAQHGGSMLTGRQVTWMVYRHFRLSESDASIAELTELFEVKVKGGDVRKFLYDWDMCLHRMKHGIDIVHLEDLFKKQLRTVPALNSLLSLYDMDVEQGRMHKIIIL